MAPECSNVPGNVDRFMTQEVGRIKNAPERGPCFFVESLLAHKPDGFLLASVNRFSAAVLSRPPGVFLPACEPSPSAAEQILEQFGLTRINGASSSWSPVAAFSIFPG